MSKNLTRKGLALGAVVALGTSLFAGAPAFATGGTISLASSFGTGTKTILGSTFQLSSTFVGATAAPGAALKYFVTGVAAGDLINVESGMNTNLTTPFSTSTSATATTSPTGVTLDPLDVSALGNYGHLRFALDTTKVTATTTVSVTAFYDNVVADGKITAGEIASSAVSVTFVRPSEVTAVATMAAPVVGATTAAPKITLGDINLQQVTAGVVRAVVTRNGSAATGVNALWNTTDASLNASVTGLTAATATDVYSARAEILNLGTGANTTGNVTSAWTANGTASSLATATSGEVASFTSLGINAGTSYRATASNVGPATQIIRSGAGSITARAVVTVDAGKARAGQTVTFIISEKGANTVDAGASITAGGKTLKNAAAADIETISVTAVTDADGAATLPISYTGIKAGNTLFVDATANGSAALIEATQFELVAQDSVAQGLIDIAASASAGANASFAADAALEAGSAVREFVKGSAVSIAYRAVDQFGQVPTGTHRVVFSGGSSINYTANVAVGTDGTVSFSGTDNNTGATSYTITATLQKADTAGAFQAIANRAITRASVIQILNAANAPSSVTVTANATDNVVRSLSTLVAGNAALEMGSVARTVNGGTFLNATVFGADGSVKDGAEVTFSAPGVLFRAGEVYGLGSLTVLTTGSGVTGNVNIYSNAVGNQTITVTSGTGTRTQVVKFAAATAITGAAWTVTAPVSILPGRTLNVSAVLADKYGAVVDSNQGSTVGTNLSNVKVDYTGPGFVTATPATETDATGKLSFTVLLGASDTGTATVKLTYGGANGTIGETTANDDVVSTTSIIIGAAPVAAGSTVARIAGSTNRFFVSVDGNTLARNVVVRVAGRSFATLKGSATNRSYAVRAPKGSHKVTVFVGGRLIATKTITVR